MFTFISLKRSLIRSNNSSLIIDNLIKILNNKDDSFFNLS